MNAPLSKSSVNPMTTAEVIAPARIATCCFQGVPPIRWPVLRSCRLSLEIVATLNTIAVVKSA